MKQAVPVCLICDKCYSVPTKVTFGSILYHANQPLNVYVVVPDEYDVGDISRSLSQVLQRLKNIGKGAGCTFKVLDGATYTERIHSFPSNDVRRDLTSTAYLKFYLHKLIDEDAILYVDVDVVALGDLAEIAKQHLETVNYIAAAENSTARQPHWVRLASIYELDPARYFNTGVMLMNLQGLREQRAHELLEKVVHDHSELMIHKDQDAFNVIYNRDHLPIARKYNVHDFSLGLNYAGIFERYFLGAISRLSKGALQNALRGQISPDTLVCHYSAQPKPWQPDGYYCRAHSDIWFHYAKIVLEPAEYASFHSLRNLALAYWARVKQLGRINVLAAKHFYGAVMRRLA